MKNIINTLVLGAILAPSVIFAQATSIAGVSVTAPPATMMMPFSTSLKFGDQGDEVRSLQDILKSDPEIYPQGLVTGYYGRLTQEALKRLQTRYSLPKTGMVDEATRAVIFPDVSNFTVTVLSPNGGETWDKSQARMITWSVSYGTSSPPTPYPMPMIEASTSGSIDMHSMMYPIDPPIPIPFFRQASIDLTRDSDPNYMRHIVNVNLSKKQYQWTIGGDVPAGSDYRVQISFARSYPCPYYDLDDLNVSAKTGGGMATGSSTVSHIRPCPMMMIMPRPIMDSSDNTFTITGAAPVNPPLTGDALQKIREQIAVLEALIAKLMAQLQAIKTGIQNY